MKRIDIETMEAGPEMDALIATEVYKWEHVKDCDWTEFLYLDYLLETSHLLQDFPFSKDTTAAHILIEYLYSLKNRYWISLCNSGTGDKKWEAVLAWKAKGSLDTVWGNGPTAPLAICRVALLAVMEFDE